jgi:hypothetical protein
MTIKNLSKQLNLTLQSFENCESIIEGKVGTLNEGDNGSFSLYVTNGQSRSEESLQVICDSLGGTLVYGDRGKDFCISGIPGDKVKEALPLAGITPRSTKKAFIAAKALYDSFDEPKVIVKSERQRKRKPNQAQTARDSVSSEVS